MQLKKFRWSKVYESSEEELVAFLDARNLSAKRVTIEAFERSEQLQFDRGVTLWCAEGSMSLQLDGTALSMQVGDALPLLAATSFRILAGMSGCAYYQTVIASSQN